MGMEKVRVFGIDLGLAPSRAAIIGSAGLLALSLWYFWQRVSVPAPHRTLLPIFFEYGFILAATFSLIALHAGFAGRTGVHRMLASRWLIIPAAVSLAGSIRLLGMRQLAGGDHSCLILSGLNLVRGHKPFHDFPCTFPPLFMIGSKWAFLTFGIKFSSFAWMIAIFAAVTFVWIYGLLVRLEIEGNWALAIALCAEAGTTIISPFWWYNQTSALIVVLVFLSSIACIRRPEGWVSWISLFASISLTLLAKPNIWPICLCVVLLLFTRSKEVWAKTLTVAFGGTAIAALSSLANGLPPTLVLRTYRQIAAGRGNPLDVLPIRELGFPERQFVLSVLAICVLTFILLIRSTLREQRHWRVVACCVVAFLTSSEMVFTNFEVKIIDMVPMVVAVAILMLRPWKNGEHAEGEGRIGLAAMLAFTLAAGVIFSATNLRVRGSGEFKFFEDDRMQAIKGGFFDGLQSGPRFLRTNEQLARVLAEHPNDKVFFGPRMEFGYAEFDKPLLKGMPIGWDPGTTFPKKDVLNILLRLQHHDPELLVFLREDYTHMGPVGFYLQHTPTYRRVDDYSELTVYVRQKEIPVTFVNIPSAMVNGE